MPLTLGAHSHCSERLTHGPQLTRTGKQQIRLVPMGLPSVDGVLGLRTLTVVTSGHLSTPSATGRRTMPSEQALTS